MKRRKFLACASAAAFAPLAAAAQSSSKVHRIAILSSALPVAAVIETGHPVYKAFFAEMRRLGYIEGQNLMVERRSAEGDAARLPTLARELVSLKPDVMLGAGTSAAVALKNTTSTIPVVAVSLDPIAFGLAISLARPGGNITGFTDDAGLGTIGKRVELLKQAAPAISRMAYLAPPGRGMRDGKEGEAFREAAERAGITPIDAPFDAPVGEAALRRALAAMAGAQVDSIYVSGAPEIYAIHRLIAELASRARLPAVYQFREAVEAGGLMAYAYDLVDIYRRTAGYADRILKGANPAEMPFQQNTKFELVINLKAAKALGLVIPASFLGIADEVIE